MSSSLKAFFLVFLIFVLSMLVPQCIDSAKAGVYKELIHYADKQSSDVEPVVICEWALERAFPVAEGMSIEYEKMVRWIVLIAEPPKDNDNHKDIKAVIILVFCYEDKSELEGYSVIGVDDKTKGYRINKDVGSYELYDFEKLEFINKKVKI